MERLHGKWDRANARLHSFFGATDRSGLAAAAAAAAAHADGGAHAGAGGGGGRQPLDTLQLGDHSLVK